MVFSYLTKWGKLLFIYMNLIKFRHVIPKETANNKYYIKNVFRKFFEKLHKTIKESISCNVGDIFYSKSNKKAS